MADSPEISIQLIDSLLKAEQTDSAIALADNLYKSYHDDVSVGDSLRARIIYTYGRVLYAAKAYDRADTILQQSLVLRQSIFADPHLDIAESQFLLAQLCNERGQRDKADPLYKAAMRTHKVLLGEKDPLFLSTWRFYARHIKNCGRFEEGRDELLKLLDVLRKIDPRPDSTIITVYWEIALVCGHLSALEDALFYYQRAYDLQVARRGDTSFTAIRLKYNMAGVNNSIGKTKLARDQYTSLIDQIETILPPDHYYHGLCRSKLASILINSGDFERAHILLDEASDYFIKAEGPVSHNLADCKYYLGLIEEKLGYFKKAERLFKESVEMIDSTFWYWDYNSYVVDPLMRLVYLYAMQGRWQEAEKLYVRIIETQIKQYGEEHIWTAESQNDLSYIYEKQGQFDKALEICKMALITCRDVYGAGNTSYATAMIRLAEIYQSRGEWHEALDTYSDIHRIQTENLGARHIEVAGTLRRMARCYGELGDFQSSHALLDSAYIIYQQSPEPPQLYIAETLREKATVYVLQADSVSAIQELQEAVTVYTSEQVSLHPDVCSTHLQLAELLANRGELRAAADVFSKYITLRRRFLNNTFIGSSEEQKLRWIQLYPPLNNALLASAVASGDDELRRVSLRMIFEGKGAVADAVMVERKNSFCSMDERVTAALDELGRLNSRVTNLALSSIGGSQAQETRDSLQYFLLQRDSLEALVSHSCSEFAEQRVIDENLVDLVAASLTPGEVLCEFAVYDPMGQDASTAGVTNRRLIRYLLDGSGRIIVDDIGTVREIDSMIADIQLSIHESAECMTPEFFPALEDALKESLDQLSDILYRPIKSRYADMNHLIVSPEGSLNLIPFEILTDKNDHYAIESHAISYVTSGRDLLRRDESVADANSSIVILACPDFNADASNIRPISDYKILQTSDGNEMSRRSQRGIQNCLATDFSPLEGSLTEAELIADLFNRQGTYAVQKFYHKEASEARLKSMYSPPTVLHVATHGYYCSDIVGDTNSIVNNAMFKSGIILAGANLARNIDFFDDSDRENGIVTAYEISGIDLSMTQLVTMSTCESGVGSSVTGEGVFGLRRALRHAGAQNILMSLWNISDAETTVFMTDFYRMWLQGFSPHEALRMTDMGMINHLRTERGHSHPYFWAAFVLARN
ncbi:MAG: CHAT domain-containing tetratricopeptide repeat protein [Candidatus Zixiibacteriota bacterium]